MENWIGLRNVYDLRLVGSCENMDMLYTVMRDVGERCQTGSSGFWILRLDNDTLDWNREKALQEDPVRQWSFWDASNLFVFFPYPKLMVPYCFYHFLAIFLPYYKSNQFIVLETKERKRTIEKDLKIICCSINFNRAVITKTLATWYMGILLYFRFSY